MSLILAIGTGSVRWARGVIGPIGAPRWPWTSAGATGVRGQRWQGWVVRLVAGPEVVG